MKLTLGFSPCPNDTFIFDAMIHHKIDTEGLDFEVFYDDVETLNQKAMRGELDITKLSYHAFAYVTDKYVLLDAGSALGFGVGPLLISDVEISISDLEKNQIRNSKSEIPLSVFPANTPPPISCSAWHFRRRKIRLNWFFQKLRMLFWMAV